MNTEEYQRISCFIQKLNFEEYLPEKSKFNGRTDFPISKHYEKDYSKRRIKQIFYNALPDRHSTNIHDGWWAGRATSYNYVISAEANTLYTHIINEDLKNIEALKIRLEFEEL